MMPHVFYMFTSAFLSIPDREDRCEEILKKFDENDSQTLFLVLDSVDESNDRKVEEDMRDFISDASQHYSVEYSVEGVLVIHKLSEDHHTPVWLCAPFMEDCQ